MLQVLCSPVFNPHGPLSWEAGDATAQAGEIRHQQDDQGHRAGGTQDSAAEPRNP